MSQIKRTHARKIFKDYFGHENHYLITILIGLDYIEKNDIQCPVDFSTSWKPDNKKYSAIKSREFCLKSFLASAVDGLDLYISELNREPRYYTNEKFVNDIFNAKRSVYEKVESVGINLVVDKTVLGLCILLITIRNNLLHSMANNTFPKEYLDHLILNKETIKENYCRLDIERLLVKTSGQICPTFKEVASLIRATQKFVEIVDGEIIKRIDKMYFENALEWYFRKNEETYLKFANSTTERRKKLIENIFQNRFSFAKEEIIISTRMMNYKK